MVARLNPIFHEKIDATGGAGGGVNNEVRYIDYEKITGYIFKRSRDNFLKFYPDQVIMYRSRLTLGKGSHRDCP